MPYKNPLDLANNINPSSVVGAEVDVPYQKGIKGKITDEIGDTYEVEYTPQNGVTRREQFRKDEYKLPKPEEETRESVLAKIGGWANEKGQYDLDDHRAYLTSDEADYIKKSVDKFGITKKELQSLHPHFFGPYGYDYGLEKAPEPQPDKHAATKAKLKEFGYSDEDIGKFKDEDFAIAADFFGRFNNPTPRK